MPGNIVSAVSQFLTPELVSRMASVAGINDAAMARRAVGAATPAILCGMANLASKPRGARSLADTIAEQSPNMLETLTRAMGGSGRLADVGQQMLTSLFGARAFGSLTSASAVDALSKLQQASSELEGLSGLAGQLPIENRNRVADAIKAGSARLKSALDAVNALPGTPADVKSAIGNLQAKLDDLTPGSLAQRTGTPPEGKAAYVATTPKGAVSARAYFDRDVYNNAGEKIGMIKDLVVGPEGGIYAAVIGVGNVLGIGEKDVAVPFSSIRVSQLDNARRLVTDATKDALKEAPAYHDSSPPRN
jgi:sporulation protein YlmC with PRC-barrel domain